MGRPKNGLVLAMLLLVAACRGTEKRERPSGPAWFATDPADPSLVIPFASPAGAAGDSSFVTDTLAQLIYGPDPADTRRGGGIRVSPAPLLNSKGLGFRVSVRW
jgi:hypothetical protein